MNTQNKQETPIKAGVKVMGTIENVFDKLLKCSLNLDNHITKEDIDEGFGEVSEFYCYEDALEIIAPRHWQEVIVTLMMGQDLEDGIVDNITAIQLTLQEDPGLIMLIQRENSQGDFEIDLVSSDLENGIKKRIEQPSVIIEILGLDPESDKILSAQYATALQEFSKFLFDNLETEF